MQRNERSNTNEWISVDFSWLWSPPTIPSCVFMLSLQLKTKPKTWPQENCPSEGVFASSERNHTWLYRGSHSAGQQTGCLCIQRAMVNTQMDRPCWAWLGATQQSSHQAHSPIPRKNKHEWYGNTKGRWLGVVCLRKTNMTCSARKTADNNKTCEGCRWCVVRLNIYFKTIPDSVAFMRAKHLGTNTRDLTVIPLE